ncbi:hypothetical protein ACFL4G_11390 [Thermodesulfobacteriota bacterium]
MNEDFRNGRFYENPFSEGLPYLRPALELSPIKLLGNAVALIILCGVSITAIACLLICLLFIAVILGKIFKIEREPLTPEIIIH